MVKARIRNQRRDSPESSGEMAESIITRTESIQNAIAFYFSCPILKAASDVPAVWVIRRQEIA
jgi:hypothetical protein